MALGLDLDSVVQALNTFSNIGGRLTMLSHATGARIYDDSYNANPTSVHAGIDVLAANAGRRILVLGDMGELGEDAPRLHREAGAYAGQVGIDMLLGCGELAKYAVEAFGDGARHFDDAGEVADALTRQLDADCVVLIKGSRFMRMEQVVQKLFNDNNNYKQQQGVS